MRKESKIKKWCHDQKQYYQQSSLVIMTRGGTRSTWKKIEDKEEVEHQLIDRNVEQFSHAGETPFGYTELGKELGHTGDSDIADSILNGTLEH
jgi:hypothetical protein